MLVFWRYLLINYLKVLALTVFCFIALLLVSRLEEIAHFAALGAKPRYLALFTLYQIPYVLPIALPISCLISAMLLFQKLSHTEELTALRSSGIALYRILSPILFAGLFFSCTTFYIASEVATTSHLATRKMAHDLSSVNPLILLQSAKIARLKNAFVQIEPIQNGRAAQNLVIALVNPKSHRLNLGLAKKIEMEKSLLRAEEVSLISTPNEEPHLLVENQKLMLTSAPELARLLKKTGWRMANDHLKLSLLRIRAEKLKQAGVSMARPLSKCRAELSRRISLGLSAFTFTLMGAAFGMKIGRNRNKKGILYALLLSATCLICFCIGRASTGLFWLSASFFFIPHLLSISLSFWTIQRINRGVS